MFKKFKDRIFSRITSWKQKDFKAILDGKKLIIPKADEAVCRLRLISLADVLVFSHSDFLKAKNECSRWPTGTIVAVATGKVLEKFITILLPKIKNEIILIALDYPYVGTDSSVNNFNNFLENVKIQHFYGENWIGENHPKLTILPIGLESPFADGSLYGNTSEEKFLDFASNSKYPNCKPLKILVNAHLNIAKIPASGRYNQRGEMEKELKENPLCDFWRTRESRESTWALHENYSFEICPEGNGIDTHRFYEAIWLKTIPIVKRNSLEQLYKKYPCLVVDNWHDINDKLLIDCLSSIRFSNELLLMGHYIDLIQNKMKSEDSFNR